MEAKALHFHIKWTACRNFPNSNKCSVVLSKLASHEIRPFPLASCRKHMYLLACFLETASYITVGIFFIFLLILMFQSIALIFSSLLSIFLHFSLSSSEFHSCSAHVPAFTLSASINIQCFSIIFIFPPLTSTNRRCLSVDDKSESVQPVHFVGTAEEPEPVGTYGLYLHTGRHIS